MRHEQGKTAACGEASVERAVAQARGTKPGAAVPANNSSQRKSGRFSHVAVVEAADLWQLNDPSQFRSLDSSRLRGVAVQRQVTT